MNRMKLQYEIFRRGEGVWEKNSEGEGEGYGRHIQEGRGKREEAEVIGKKLSCS